MRITKIFHFAIILTLAFAVGCKQNPHDRAKQLITNSATSLKSTAFQLDSIVSYPESYELRIKAANLYTDQYSYLNAKLVSINELREKGDTVAAGKIAEQTREHCISLIRTAQHYQEQAAGIEFKNEMGKITKELVGWECDIVDNGTNYTLYFDKEVTSILATKNLDQ